MTVHASSCSEDVILSAECSKSAQCVLAAILKLLGYLYIENIMQRSGPKIGQGFTQFGVNSHFKQVPSCENK
eukprot:4235256-Pleurochrysis_carterae.AAC.1